MENDLMEWKATSFNSSQSNKSQDIINSSLLIKENSKQEEKMKKRIEKEGNKIRLSHKHRFKTTRKKIKH